MGLFQITTVVIVLTAVFSYLNTGYVGLPTTIGVMAIALATSLLFLGVGEIWPAFRGQVVGVVQNIDFNKTLFHGMLAFLLFAGAAVEAAELLREFAPITLLAVFGTVISTFLIAVLAFVAMRAGGVALGFQWCLLFEALVSPTDPIAVISIMGQAGTPPIMQTQIAGESLFNDGVGIVLYSVLLTAVGGEPERQARCTLSPSCSNNPSAASASACSAGCSSTRCSSESTITKSNSCSASPWPWEATPGQSPQILRPHRRRRCGVADRQSRPNLRHVGGEPAKFRYFLGADRRSRQRRPVRPDRPGSAGHSHRGKVSAARMLCVPVALGARWASVAAMVSLIRTWQPMAKGTVRILTWSGLRGGLSMAMALAIPPAPIAAQSSSPPTPSSSSPSSCRV